MNDYKKDLQELEKYFKKSGAFSKLNVTEEVLEMYIGVINSEDGEYVELLAQRCGLDESKLYEIIDQYTLEVGAVMAGLLDNIAKIMHTEDQKIIQRDIEKIAQELIPFMGKNDLEILENLINDYQAEFELFKMNFSFNEESTQMIDFLSENSQLLSFDSAKVEQIPQEKRYVFIAMILQEVFMVMGIVQMKEMMDGNSMDMISQEEYEDEDFNIKEKMIAELEKAKSTNDVIYEKDDFAYSLTDKVTCNICHKSFANSGIQRHVSSCSKKYVENAGRKKSSYLLKISDKYMEDYFLHVLVSEDAQLKHLDTFLRDIWLECCGHMSGFRQGRDELEMDDYVECLSHTKKTEYTYDYGSSTNLIIEFKKEFQGSQEQLIKLVARNATIKAECHRCEKKDAKYICTECMYGGDEVIFCEDCVKKHTEKYHEGEEYMISHFVNSPRTGVCGYAALEEEL